MVNVSLPTIDDVRSKADPAPAWRWIVRLPTDFIRTDGSVNAFGNGGAYGGLLSRSALPFVIVEQIDFQTRQIDMDARFGGGIKTKYPRFQDMPTLSLTMFEDNKYTMTRYIKEWMNAVIDEDGNVGLPRDYKRNIKLYAYNIVNNTVPVFLGTYRDCWPMGLSGMSYDYEHSGHVTGTVEFACDKDFVEWQDADNPHNERGLAPFAGGVGSTARLG